MEKKKVAKKVEKKVKKNFFQEVPGMHWGYFWGYQGTKKIIPSRLRPIFFSQNENPQRWIDSQLNSASFKTDFKLK